MKALDVTGVARLKTEYQESRTVLCYIQIDNYDEVMQRQSEAERTSLLLAVNQALDNWLKNLGGFMRRVSDDLYVVILERKALDKAIAARFDILDKLGKTYYERENTSSQQAAMFQEVKRIITDFSENSEMLRELEQMADTCHDNVMQKLRQDFPAMKENDIRLLCYIFTGFSPQVISLFTKESVANIYARKSRLKSRIKAAGTPHTDLFLSLFG